jgi:type IV pilus assembly protein PilO
VVAMNELLERFLELPPRQRALLLGTGLLLLFFFYGYFWYAPRNAMIAQKEAQRDQLQKDRDRKAALVANLAHTRAEVARLTGDLKTAAAQLPTTKEIPDLLSNVSSLGRESGLDIVQFRQRPEQLKDFYAEVPVDIVVRGTYNQVVAFFDKVAHMARIVNVTDVNIKSPPTIADPVTLDTACTAVTFRFLDEAERARIAKQKALQKKGGKP